MSLKHVDIEAGLRRLADRRIEEAMKEGKFNNLRGAGQPLNLEPMPADENARMTWWMLRILKNNDFTPEEVVWRKQIDGLKDELDATVSEARVKVLVRNVNALVHRLNTLGTNALKSPIVALSEQAELERLRERLAAAGRAAVPAAISVGPVVAQPPVGGVRHCINRGCEVRNPADARYCRRCGAAMPAA